MLTAATPSSRRGKVHGSLARAGKVKSQTPKVEPQEKKKHVCGRAKKRLIYNRRFVNVRPALGGPYQRHWLTHLFPQVTEQIGGKRRMNRSFLQASVLPPGSPCANVMCPYQPTPRARVDPSRLWKGREEWYLVVLGVRREKDNPQLPFVSSPSTRPLLSTCAVRGYDMVHRSRVWGLRRCCRASTTT